MTPGVMTRPGNVAKAASFGPKLRAPKGLEDSAQGFNPGFNPGNRPERFALKGRQIERTNNAKVGPIVARLNCAL